MVTWLFVRPTLTWGSPLLPSEGQCSPERWKIQDPVSLFEAQQARPTMLHTWDPSRSSSKETLMTLLLRFSLKGYNLFICTVYLFSGQPYAMHPCSIAVVLFGLQGNLCIFPAGDTIETAQWQFNMLICIAEIVHSILIKLKMCTHFRGVLSDVQTRVIFA